jgi:hypothetical protein
MSVVRYFLWGSREINEHFSFSKGIEILIMMILAGLLLIIPHLINFS